ncbi:MAG: mechanosensitive ion channel, partial [Oscillospiraceae bacterium]
WIETFIANYGGKILLAIIILIIGFLLIKGVLKLVKKSLKKSKLSITVHKFFLSSIKIFLWVILILTILQIFNVPTTSLIALLSVFGLAISLAVQGSLSNVAGGIIILFSRPFEVGDYVKVGDVEGVVKSINILHTTLDTVDNKAIYITNGEVSNGKIINFSGEENRRLDIIFSISYLNDFEKAKELIKQYIENHPLALKDPQPLVRVCEYASSSINIVSRVWVKTENYWDLNFDMLENIKKLFDENQIIIPHDQLDVVLHDNKN